MTGSKPSNAAMDLANAILDVMLPEPFRTETAAIPGTIEDMAAQVQSALADLLEKASIVATECSGPSHMLDELAAALEPWKDGK